APFLTPVSTTLSLRFRRLSRLPPGCWFAVWIGVPVPFLVALLVACFSWPLLAAPGEAARAARRLHSPLPHLCLGSRHCDPISSRPAAAKTDASAMPNRLAAGTFQRCSAARLIGGILRRTVSCRAPASLNRPKFRAIG